MNRINAKNYILEECGEGWVALNEKVYDNLPMGIEIKSVYQKYGGLKFDFEPDHKSFEFFLYDIEEESLETCEKCGCSGSTYNIQNWLYTRCEKHCEGGVDLNNLPDAT